MNERKATKRALLTSITALVMCVVMLAGTTFAWFTDTASTNVNKIQAGNLDVALEMLDGTNWVTAEGKTLEFKKADAATSGEKVLWEPGAEYKLPELKIVNNGNLALKYEIAITGAVDADGDNNLDSMKLLNVLKFKSVVGSTTEENVYGKTIATGTLYTKDAEQIIQLSAKMDENAGNGYMNMALSNITVTVKAMQASFEHDSNGNTYDLDANGNPDNPTWSVSAHVTANVAATGDTVLKNADGTVELTAPAGSTNNATRLTLKVEPKTAAENNFTVNAGQTAQPYEISLVDENDGSVTAASGKVFTVKLYVGKGLDSNNVKVYHNSDEITGAQYDSNSGYVTFTTNSFSPFTVVFDTPVAIVGDTYYNTLAEAVAAAKDGNTIKLLKNAEVENYIAINGGKNIVLDLNGHDVVHNGNYLFDVYNAKFHVTGEGTLFENVKNGYAPIIARGSATDTADYTVITIDKGVTLKGDYTGIFVANDAGNGYHNYGLVINMFGTIDMGAVADGYHYSGMYVNGTNTVSDGNVMTINLDGATIKNCAGAGIYAAGYAKWNITNSSITGGDTGIEIRAGELALNDCALEATAEVFSCDPNGNGATTEGAAIAIAQHTTKKDIAVTINGGSFKGVKALNESNPQANDPAPQVKLSIDGGTFIGDISTVDVTGFIKGGTFSSQPDSKYIAEGYTCTKTGEDVWTVAMKSQSN